MASLELDVSPRTLPTNEYVPVKWAISGKVLTRDGTHPSALREIQLGIDKSVRINARDYPVCDGSGRAVRVLDTKAAAKACEEALVGRGKALIELAFPGQEPIDVSSQLLVFNGGERDRVARLLLHLFVPVPRPSTNLGEVQIRRKGTGLEAVAKVPVIAGGNGSLLDFRFTIGKTSSYKGKKVGYFEAKCPDGVFKGVVKKMLFRNEAKVPGIAAQTILKGGLAAPCTSKAG